MPGLHPADKQYWREYPTNRDDGYTTKYVVRMPIAIFGRGTEGDPFDHKYRDNYVEGKGYTKEAALKELKAAFDSIHEGLWAEPSLKTEPNAGSVDGNR